MVQTNEIETTGSGNQIQIGLPDNVTIAGNLTVGGTTTTVNSTTVSIDPVFEIGDDSSDDNLDRGIKFKYNSSSVKLVSSGFDDSTGKFVKLVASPADSSSTFSGTALGAVFGTVEASGLNSFRVYHLGERVCSNGRSVVNWSRY